MAIRRRIDPDQGRSALEMWAAQSKLDAGPADRSTVATAGRFTLGELGARAGGNRVEVRGPPLRVTRCIAAPRPTRGTPPNVVETSAEVWLGLVTGSTDFATALEAGSIEASGTRADLSEHLPLFSPAESEERR